MSGDGGGVNCGDSLFACNQESFTGQGIQFATRVRYEEF